MSLSKKDPSLRVAANDPHLVSLGGDRLSTAVTIHNIPVGDCTIGSSSECTVSLNGAGVKPIHCTIYRSEENQVILVPEHNARVLIDNCSIETEVDLRQGAMITIGDSYYLRYNNPAEALKIRSAIGDIVENTFSRDLDFFYESKFCRADRPSNSYYDNLKKTDAPLNFEEWQCPKVFSADMITVNMPAKDVLGQKYASFAKNLAEHHSKDKKIETPNSNLDLFDDFLNKLSKGHDGVEKENLLLNQLKSGDMQSNLSKLKENEADPLESMLKICAEYTDSQEQPYTCNRSRTSSPIVQNRIITNGSLPRDKKPQLQNSFSESCSSPAGKSSEPSRFENESYLKENSLVSIKNFASDNIEVGSQNFLSLAKLNYSSPKTETFLNNYPLQRLQTYSENLWPNREELVKNCEEHFQSEIEAFEENSKSLNINKSSYNEKPGRINNNINNPTIDIKSFVSPYSSPISLKKYSYCNKEKAGLTNLLANSCYDKWNKEQDDLLKRIQSLKTELNLLQQQGNETLTGIDMEHALIIVEQQALLAKKQKLQDELKLLQQKIYRLEAQRNAARVIEENQQSKLQHSIEMREDQVMKLKELLKQKPDNNCLQEELSNVQESLENDKKLFEDLEFQYLEGESEWQAYRDDLSLDEKKLNKQIEDCQLSLEHFEQQLLNSSNTISEQQQSLSNHLISLIRDLHQCELQFKFLERQLLLKTISNSSLSEQEDDKNHKANRLQADISPSLFGTPEKLNLKKCNDNLMSKSMNENILYRNQTDFPENELTFDSTKSKIANIDLKSDNSKMKELVKETRDQRQQLNQKGLRDLNCQRRKIEEILKKLNLNDKTLQIATNQKDVHIKSKRNSVVSDNNLQGEIAAGPVFTNSSPSSAASLQLPKKCLANIVDKSVLPKMSYMTDTRDNITNSNELSSQGGSSVTSWDSNINQQQRKQRPLTRYLPIFAENLDLKRHIESAGHPLSLCHNVFLDAYSCRGYLNKLGSTFHTWSKRWFVLDRRRNALVYYADKSERKPRGGSCFSSIEEVYMDHLNVSKSGRIHSTFIVKTKRKTYFLQASSDSAARIWIDAIITGAQGSIDY